MASMFRIMLSYNYSDEIFKDMLSYRYSDKVLRDVQWTGKLGINIKRGCHLRGPRTLITTQKVVPPNILFMIKFENCQPYVIINFKY